MNMMSTYYRSGAYKMTQGKSFHRGTTYSFHRGTVKGYIIPKPQLRIFWGDLGWGRCNWLKLLLTHIFHHPFATCEMSFHIWIPQTLVALEVALQLTVQAIIGKKHTQWGTTTTTTTTAKFILGLVFQIQHTVFAHFHILRLGSTASSVITIYKVIYIGVRTPFRTT